MIQKYQKGYRFFSKFFPSHYLYTNPTIRQVKRQDIGYLLDISDYVEWWIYFDIVDIAHERLFELCNPDDVVLDIGTNIGSTLLRFAQKTSLGAGQVIGFEPDSINYQKCLENISLNNFTNIEVNKLGLGAYEKSLYLITDTPSNRGCNRIRPTMVNDSYAKELIKIVLLDIFLEKKYLKSIDPIKIDVEGYEHEVLKGAKKTIAKYHPVLFIEIDDNNLKQQNSSASNVISWLDDIGYSIKRADTFEPVGSNYKKFKNCHFDVICFILT